MTPFYLTLGLVTQAILIIAAEPDVQNLTTVLDTMSTPQDDIVKDFKAAPLDWMDVVLGSTSTPIYPSSSAALMSQAVLSDKPPEEQLEDIKEMANQITMAIQSEMVNLLSYAISATDGTDSNKLRKKRSIESPMDSTQLVMRLLKHIKSNNDYQNIAIEKMMSAQEIADKYGIPFKADPDILTDLAVAGNEQAKELTSILQDVCDINNTTKSQPSHKNIEQPRNKTLQTQTPSQQSRNENYFTPSSYSSEPLQQFCSPVTPRPNFYDTISYKPVSEYPYCSVEPVTSVITEPIETEPEFVGEEIEETLSSKMYVKEDEPGSLSVSNVLTYSVAETSHFRKPQIEALPQQMQYYFYLI